MVVSGVIQQYLANKHTPLHCSSVCNFPQMLQNSLAGSKREA
jgi:hypothetical protein